MASFNPWKKAKQHREATEMAEAFFEAQKSAGAFWKYIEDEGDVSADLQANDDDGVIYGYFTSVHSFYDLVELHPTNLKLVEEVVVDVLNAIVAKNKNLTLTQLLNDPIVIQSSKLGILVMPKFIRFYDLGNNNFRIGDTFDSEDDQQKAFLTALDAMLE